MTLNEIEQAICEMVARYLRVPSHAVARESSLKKQGMDSLGMMDLLCDIEEDFLQVKGYELRETPAELQQYDTVKKIAEKLATILSE